MPSPGPRMATCLHFTGRAEAVEGRAGVKCAYPDRGVSGGARWASIRGCAADMSTGMRHGYASKPRHYRRDHLVARAARRPEPWAAFLTGQEDQAPIDRAALAAV